MLGSLCQINRVKHLFDRCTLITIINSLVFSKLLYCSSVWANTTKKKVELLQTVQNFAARIVSGTRKFDHVTPILKSAGPEKSKIERQISKFQNRSNLGF